MTNPQDNALSAGHNETDCVKGNQKKVMTLPPRVLAYIGDGVYELWVREQAIKAGVIHLNQLHQWVTQRVKASFQAQLIDVLNAELTEPEKDWFRRGRNAGLTANKRHQQNIHRQASGFETMIGWLHYTNQNRLQELFSLILQSNFLSI